MRRELRDPRLRVINDSAEKLAEYLEGDRADIIVSAVLKSRCGRSLISVRCQEDRPGLADAVAVVRRGELVRPVALRLDACGGRWTVTELRWWRNETDTAVTPGRDGGSS